jgi:hypothetical protein
MIAQNLYGFSEFYEIFNELNPIYKEGIELLQNGDYKKLKLAREGIFK